MIGQTELFKFGMTTVLGEGKKTLNSNLLNYL